jgi:hypothetical protein
MKQRINDEVLLGEINKLQALPRPSGEAYRSLKACLDLRDARKCIMGLEAEVEQKEFERKTFEDQLNRQIDHIKRERTENERCRKVNAHNLQINARLLEAADEVAHEYRCLRQEGPTMRKLDATIIMARKVGV